MSLQKHEPLKTPTNSPNPSIDRGPNLPPNTPAESPVRPDLFRRMDFTDSNVGFHGGSRKRAGVKLALWTWLSASVDALVLTSISCFFMILFSMLMKTSALQVLRTLQISTSMLTWGAVVFIGSFSFYLIFMRVFNGATLGEWTCDLRLGQPIQRNQSSYIAKVFLRTAVILFTGIITLPLLSLILRKDLAGQISGVKIYSLV